MKKYIFLIILLTFQIQLFSQIRDIIKPIKIKSGEEKEIVISDLFFLDNYDVKFLTNRYFKIDFNKSTKILKLKPYSYFVGFANQQFIYKNKSYSIPVFVDQVNKIKFVFTTTKQYKQVSVFGEFNAWNRNQYFMEKSPEGFSIEIEIEPGTYQYKFFADGEEIVDSNNPDSISNGMGSFNSILEVKDLTKKIFLHKKTMKEENNIFEFSFFIPDFNNISKNNVYGYLDNKQISTENIVVDEKTIKVKISKNDLSDENVVRVLYAEKGIKSNIQFVFLKDKKIISEENIPNDWRNSTIYSLLIDRFYDGDKSINKPIEHEELLQKANYFGGDLLGIIKQIENGYFDSLSVNVLWISPVYDNPEVPYKEYPAPHRWFTGYHGYWPINSFEVEQRFGTLETLKELVEVAHRHKIKVLLDFVSNHVHKENPYYQNHPEWFGKLDLPDGRKNLRFWDEFRLTTWFEPYLPSFDFLGSKEALDFMVENALWWMRNTNADGFRHDAVKHVPNEFWRELTRQIKLEKNVKVYQIGETFGSYDLVSSYVNNGQLDAQFNFNLYNTAQAVFIDSSKSFIDLEKELQKTFEVYGVDNVMGNIMDSHDKNRFMAYADGDLKLEQWSAIEEGWNNPPTVDNPLSYKKAELYYAYMFGIPGLPVVYYGSEFGMTGASDPDNRRMMRFGKDLNKEEKQMLSRVRILSKIRRKSSALNYGDFSPLLVTKNLFGFIRSDFNQRILVVLNKNSQLGKQAEINFPKEYDANNLTDLVSGKQSVIENNSTIINLENSSWKIFEIK